MRQADTYNLFFKTSKGFHDIVIERKL